MFVTDYYRIIVFEILALGVIIIWMLVERLLLSCLSLGGCFHSFLRIECLVLVQSQIKLKCLKFLGCGTIHRLCSTSNRLQWHSCATPRPVRVDDVSHRHRCRWELLLHRLLLQVVGALIQRQPFLVVPAPAQSLVVKRLRHCFRGRLRRLVVVIRTLRVEVHQLHHQAAPVSGSGRQRLHRGRRVSH